MHLCVRLTVLRRAVLRGGAGLLQRLVRDQLDAVRFPCQRQRDRLSGSVLGGIDSATGPLVFQQGTVLSLPNNTVPAGYALEIDLINDSAGNITGATFSVTDNTGKTTSVSSPTLDANQQFPIVAFQVNVVGPDNESDSQFYSGAGTITYEISNGQLCVEGGLPDTCSNSLGSSTPTGRDFQRHLWAHPIALLRFRANSIVKYTCSPSDSLLPT
jgi:hypothetical protein